MTKKIIILSAAVLLFGAEGLVAQSRQPRLVVNIVLSTLRSEDVARYGANVGKGGVAKHLPEGCYFPDCRYNTNQTYTATALATLSSGAYPSTHGIVSESWYDYVTNSEVRLIKDEKAYGIGCSYEAGQCSAKNMIAETLTQKLLDENKESKCVTVALAPVSAIVMGGDTPNVYWLDAARCRWITSSAFSKSLPAWVDDYNNSLEMEYKTPVGGWQPILGDGAYVNKRRYKVKKGYGRNQDKEYPEPLFQRHGAVSRYETLMSSPSGNTMVLDFALRAIAQNGLGRDAEPDLVNICLDATEGVTSVFGPESCEAEEMYYRLDADLAKFIADVYSVTSTRDVVFVVTAAHGTSASWSDGSKIKGRFNPMQFEVIVNSFISTRYGAGKWVLGYRNHSLYLNHTLAFTKGLDIAQLQNEVATFAMQFDGVAHALSSTALRSSSFYEGYGAKMQRGFHPRRSGDVMLNLMPGWIEMRTDCRSMSGSMYGYDDSVPLLIFGKGVKPVGRINRKVNMADLTPTLARLIGVSEPSASDGDVILEIF